VARDSGSSRSAPTRRDPARPVSPRTPQRASRWSAISPASEGKLANSAETRSAPPSQDCVLARCRGTTSSRPPGARRRPRAGGVRDQGQVFDPCPRIPKWPRPPAAGTQVRGRRQLSAGSFHQHAPFREGNILGNGDRRPGPDGQAGLGRCPRDAQGFQGRGAGPSMRARSASSLRNRASRPMKAVRIRREGAGAGGGPAGSHWPVEDPFLVDGGEEACALKEWISFIPDGYGGQLRVVVKSTRNTSVGTQIVHHRGVVMARAGFSNRFPRHDKTERYIFFRGETEENPPLSRDATRQAAVTANEISLRLGKGKGGGRQRLATPPHTASSPAPSGPHPI